MPPTGWQKTTETYSCSALETRNLNSRCWQGRPPSERSREDCFLASANFCWLWLSLLFFGLCLNHTNLCLHFHMVSSSGSLSPLLFLQGPQSLDFQIRSHPEDPGEHGYVRDIIHLTTRVEKEVRVFLILSVVQMASPTDVTKVYSSPNMASPTAVTKVHYGPRSCQVA